MSTELDTDFAGETTILAERFEVGAADLAEFDDWLDGPHLEAVTGLPGMLRVRTFHQQTDVPARFPYDRYSSWATRLATSAA